MGKYLKKFETTSQYNAYTADTENFIKPNVSLITETNTVEYNPYVIPPTPSHPYVDLGLPSGTKWATMNIGASSETDYGNYYQYGKGAAQYAETSGQSEYTGTENPLAASADTVTQVWGGSWHMPTKAQFQELTANTTYTWETNFNGSGVNGGKFTAQNGNYVFFAAAGRWYEGSQVDVGSVGICWSSTPSNSSNACIFLFLNAGKDVDDYGGHDGGCSVRGVVD